MRYAEVVVDGKYTIAMGSERVVIHLVLGDVWDVIAKELYYVTLERGDVRIKLTRKTFDQCFRFMRGV